MIQTNSKSEGSGIPANLKALSFLIVLYVTAMVAVNPTGDFPLNDDWSWAYAARSLTHAHDWRPTGFTGMPLITHSIWAAPFCMLSNCSYEALRASSLVAGVLLLISSYYLFMSVVKSPFVAGLTAATVAFNPLIFVLSYSFMTEALFAGLLVISAYVFLKTFRHVSKYLFGLACLLAVATTLCRQLGLCIPAAYMVVCLFRPGDFVEKIIRAFLPLVLCLAALVGFETWMQQTGRLPALYYKGAQDLIRSIQDPGFAERTAIFNVATILLYLGLFSLPLLILRRVPADEKAGAIARRMPTAVGILAAIAAPIVIFSHKPGLLPVLGNILAPTGLGPLLLRDTYILDLENVPPLPVHFWAIVTALGVLGLFGLVKLICVFAMRLFGGKYEATARQAECSFAAVCAIVYFAPLLAIPIFDRYIAPIIPIVFLFILAVTQPAQMASVPGRALAAAACVCLSLFAVLGTHDYLSWNRARWQAIADLMRLENADPSKIDGGFEFNGSTSYDPNYRLSVGISWWWVKDDVYQVTFGPIEGMTELRRYDYTTYLPPDVRTIHVLQRTRCC